VNSVHGREASPRDQVGSYFINSLRYSHNLIASAAVKFDTPGAIEPDGVANVTLFDTTRHSPSHPLLRTR